ncbi:hypothetical protein ACJMK2_028508 [Sinanodonta woodiana]|uniref:SAC domain-containing protein n=1 Tax=Sinanodonta woodiana TaxID=1069815 RepID=A0ABD3X7C3_SINWO
MECQLISCIQKLTLYETKARYYIVGSNETESAFRVLKIDRTEPKELQLQDDKHTYNKTEIADLLTTIEHGNLPKTSQKGSSIGFTRTVSAFGIVGFVRFLEGYYIILITKRRKIALIGPHTIYKIVDTAMLYIPNDSVRCSHPDESKYVKLFQSVDLSTNFYFSYSYDLTHTLQFNMTPTITMMFGLKNSPEYKFVWNKYLLEKFEGRVDYDWVLYIIYGFIAQYTRRSNEFAGTRFLKRGTNCEGAVANEVETEQIVHDASLTSLNKTRVSSFVQTRGSIPIFWSQDVSTMVPRPTITVDQSDPYFHAAGLHFNWTIRRYGAPIIVLSLVKRREKRRHESILCDEFKSAVTYLNQFLPEEHHIRYIGFDMAYSSKSKTKDVLSRLAEISHSCIKMTGFYLSVPKPVNDYIWTQEEFKDIQSYKTQWGSKQTGVIRTNCVDCLDRTNTAQFALGKCALSYQLCALGVLSTPELDFDTDCLRMLEDLYEDLGDTIALQYGGSQLVHRIEGYRKIAVWKAHSRDILQTLSRYYSNTFSDMEKQQATNIFLGLFVPKEGQPNIWELVTDFYLHNRDARGCIVPRKRYTNWCNWASFKCLPLPSDEVYKSDDFKGVILKTDPQNDRVDHFQQYYKPYQLTVLQDLYCSAMAHSIRNFMPKSAVDFSPFTRRVIEKGKDVNQEVNPNISGKDSTASVTSTGSEDASLSSNSSLEIEGDITITNWSTDESDDFHEIVIDKSVDSVCCRQDSGVYGLELRTPNDVNIYERYADLGKACIKPEKKGRNVISTDCIEITPLTDYRDCFVVGIPTVHRGATELYTSHVRCGRNGPVSPSQGNQDIYKDYIRRKYK